MSDAKSSAAKPVLWDWIALKEAAGVGAVADGRPIAAIAGFSIDTRTLAAGDVFVALKDQRDGHEFVTQAFAKGAAAAIVSHLYERDKNDGALLRVNDPLAALEAIGAAARARLRPGARVVAVTGSAGKTGTKEMLRVALGAAGRVHASEKSYNNHWGVPLTLARMPADVDFAVLEMGMNHAGEIAPLSCMARPHIAIVTNVLPVHIGHFANGEVGIADAKAEIFSGLEAPTGWPAPVAILPRDSAHFPRLADAARAVGARVLSFGQDPESDIGLFNAQASLDADSQLRIIVATLRGRAESNQNVQYDLAVPGHHITMNSLAVVLALDALQCDLSKVLPKFASIEAAAGRGARQIYDMPDGPLLLIDESYNANPASMAAAIETLREISDHRFTRKIAIIGDMRELGDAAPRFHAELRDDILGLSETVKGPGKRDIDLIFACGPEMQATFAGVSSPRLAAVVPASTDLVAPVLAALRSGDVVMIKGSLGTRMAPIVDAIKARFAAATS